MATMTITRALNELKLLDKRISKKIKNSVFLGFTVGGEQYFKENYAPKETLQSVKDLITQRQSIKAAIMVSNANTKVKIGDTVMTVVDAIEMKDSIKYKKLLLKELEGQASTIRAKINNGNMDVSARLDALLAANFGKDSKTKADEFDSVSKPFLAKNEYKEDDQIQISSVIEALEEEIDTFESEVDFVLSESNAVTKIEV